MINPAMTTTRDVPSRTKEPTEFRWSQAAWLVLLVLHVLLALVMNASQLVSTIHAVLTLAVGLYIVLTAKRMQRITWIAAYICGMEVLWRMTNANVFWEYGKYAIVLLMVITLLRLKKVRNARLPVLYFLLLTFSIPLTLFALDFDNARQQISFNLSGPLCLAVSVLFFYQVRLNWKDREVLVWYLVAPIMGIAALCLRGIFTAEELIFGKGSSFAASGGFGPNQVSAVLGLGAVALLLLVVQERSALRRWIPLLLALALMTLSALTFSRGGLYNLAAALAILLIFSLRSNRLRNTLLPVVVIGVVIGAFVLYPRLNEITGGMLKVRYSDTTTTGRVEVMQAELNTWKEHLVFGVGPGLGVQATRKIMGMSVAAHTEYTRILAEHGIPGAFAILLMLIISFKAVINAPKGLPQAWVAALFTWSLMEMTHAAMRIAAIGFIFGLAVALWKSNGETSSQSKSRVT